MKFLCLVIAKHILQSKRKFDIVQYHGAAFFQSCKMMFLKFCFDILVIVKRELPEIELSQ